MTDTSDSNPTQEQTQDQTETPEEVTFTEDQQRFIDEIISKRLGGVKAKHDAEVKALREQHQKELKRATMAEEERLKAEAEDQLNALKQRAEDAERGLRLATTQRAAVEAGLPSELAEMLMGTDDEATQRNIATVRKAIDERASALYAERVGKGTPKAPDHAPSDWTSDLRSVMGLSAKERRD